MTLPEDSGKHEGKAPHKCDPYPVNAIGVLAGKGSCNGALRSWSQKWLGNIACNSEGLG